VCICVACVSGDDIYSAFVTCTSLSALLVSTNHWDLSRLLVSSFPPMKRGHTIPVGLISSPSDAD
jgi:hypothetical protein